jgi:hypothetical protein
MRLNTPVPGPMLVIFRVTDGVLGRQISLLRRELSLTANGPALTLSRQFISRSANTPTYVIQISLCFRAAIRRKSKNKFQHAVEIATFWATNVLGACGGRAFPEPRSQTPTPVCLPFAPFRWHKGKTVDLEHSGDEGLRASARRGQS